jgi:DNA-binding NarL/FixJ family response regulator
MKALKRTARQAISNPAALPQNTNACSVSIVQRRYVADLRPEIKDELFARIECAAQVAFFPLATNDRAVAQRKAERMRVLTTASGWQAVGAKHVREFTLAIFWLPNPLTCTSTSLFTRLEMAPVRLRMSGRRVRVALFEPDANIRWALMNWINELPDYECLFASGSADDFLRSVTRRQADVALFDEPPCALGSEHIQARLARDLPTQIGFPFGVYSDSEHAWHSVTGVDGGYYYRRRNPQQMLAPISGLWQLQAPSRDAVETQIRHHIQTLFGLRAATPDAFPGLTKREREVLTGLRRGHTDKTLAAMLGISSWTVHTHMKSLFDKLGVHTRAEAVAKLFDK